MSDHTRTDHPRLFTAYSLTISSPRVIPELRPRDGGPPSPVDVAVTWPDDDPPARVDWFRDWGTGDPGTQLRAGRVASGDYLLEFTAGATFVVEGEGRSVTCFATGGVRPEVLGRLLCDQVLPLTLTRRGLAVFHGSAVVIHGTAALFLGPSGSGKSTLAAALGRLGYPILTDDCVVVTDSDDGRPVVAPSYPGVRLWPDSLARFWDGSDATAPVSLENGKARYATSGALPHSDSATPLGPVFLLATAAVDEVAVEPVGGAAAIGEIVSCQFVLDHTDRIELSVSFAAASRLAAHGPVRRLSLPADLDAVDHHARVIADLVSQ